MVWYTLYSVADTSAAKIMILFAPTYFFNGYVIFFISAYHFLLMKKKFYADNVCAKMNKNNPKICKVKLKIFVLIIYFMVTTWTIAQMSKK